MKKIFYLLILFPFLFSSCDYIGNYTFTVKNSTEKTITLKFSNEPHYDIDENKEEIILYPAEEKTVRLIDAPMNSPVHDCLTDHGIMFFYELVFDTYIDGEKLEKQLWQAENWQYYKKSKWQAGYNMIITNEMIEK